MTALFEPPNSSTTVATSATYSSIEIEGSLTVQGTGTLVDVQGTATTMGGGNQPPGSITVQNGAALRVEGSAANVSLVTLAGDGASIEFDGASPSTISLGNGSGGTGTTLATNAAVTIAAAVDVNDFLNGDSLHFLSPATSFTLSNNVLTVTEQNGAVIPVSFSSGVYIARPAASDLAIVNGAIVYAPPRPPRSPTATITGSAAGSVAVGSTTTPFAAVAITDSDPARGETVVIQFDSPTGTLMDPNAAADGSVWNAGAVSYTVSGTPAVVTQALDGLVFTPKAYTLAAGQTAPATARITVSNSAGNPAVDSNSVISITPSPTPLSSLITAPGSSLTLTSAATYSSLDAGGYLAIDGAGARISVQGTAIVSGGTVTVGNGGALRVGGSASGLGGVTLYGDGASVAFEGATPPVITLGADSLRSSSRASNASVTLTGATTIVDFSPSDSLHFPSPAVSISGAGGTVSVTEQNGATIPLTFSNTGSGGAFQFGALALSNGAVVYNTAPPPRTATITGANPTTVPVGSTNRPFAAVAITDTDPARAETVVIQFDSPTGTLMDPNAGADGSVWNAGAVSYTVSGTPAVVTQALDGLVFTPKAYTLAAGQTAPSTARITVSNSAGDPAVDGNSVISITPSPTPLSSLITAPGSSVTLTRSATYSSLDAGGYLAVDGAGARIDVQGPAVVSAGSVGVGNGGSLRIEGSASGLGVVGLYGDGASVAFDGASPSGIVLGSNSFRSSSLATNAAVTLAGDASVSLFQAGDSLHFLSPAAAFTINGGVLTVTEQSGAAVSVALTGTGGTPPAASDLAIADGAIVFAPVVVRPKTPPIVSGTASQTVAAGQSLRLFANVTITGPNPALADAVSLSVSPQIGTLTDPNAATDGSTRDSSGALYVNGTPDFLTGIIDSVVFTAKAYTLAPGQTTSATAAILAASGMGDSTLDQTTGVTVTAAPSAAGPADPNGAAPVAPVAAATPVSPAAPVTPVASPAPATPMAPVAAGDVVTPGAGDVVTPGVPSSPASTVPSFAFADATSGAGGLAQFAAADAGAPSYLQWQYIYAGPDSIAYSSETPNAFIHGGSGDDAIQVASGQNVLDGGLGSNFLTGGSGTDTFFTDARQPGFVWNTIRNFHGGDAATLWGFTAGVSSYSWQPTIDGAPGDQGATLRTNIAGGTGPGSNGTDASITFSGLSVAQARNLEIVTGSQSAGNYLFIYNPGV